MLQQISKFDLVSDYDPTGDQPEAIDALVKGVEKKICSNFTWCYGKREDFFSC